MIAASEGSELPPGTMRRGARVQMRVIGALVMRELHTRYGRENVGYIWLFLEPMMLASMVALLHSKAPGHASGDIRPIPLALLGYTNFMTFRSIFSRSSGALEANLPLLNHRTISLPDILVARALLEAAGTSLAFAVLMGLAIAMGFADLPVRPLYVLLGMLLIVWISLALGMVVCGLTHDRPAIERLVHPLTYIMMPMSGAFFTMHGLPDRVREIFLWIPLAHIFEILRYGWFKSAHYEYIDWMYLGAWLLVSTLLGLLMLSVTRQRIHMP